LCVFTVVGEIHESRGWLNLLKLIWFSADELQTFSCVLLVFDFSNETAANVPLVLRDCHRTRTRTVTGSLFLRWCTMIRGHQSFLPCSCLC